MTATRSTVSGAALAHAREIAALRIVCLLTGDWVTNRRTPRTTAKSRCALVGVPTSVAAEVPPLAGGHRLPLHRGSGGGSSWVLGADVGSASARVSEGILN